jgi:hypothetical protein
MIGAIVRLIFSDQNWMWHRQKSNQCTMLQEFQNFAFVSQTPKQKMVNQI